MIEFRDYKFHTYCKLFETEMSKGVAQPSDSDIKHLLKFFAENPGRNKMMIDVGAHIGGFSVIYSQYFDRIYSFEPNKKSYEYLEKNLKLNNCTNVTTWNFAISNDLDSGDMVHYGNPDNSATFKLVSGDSVKCAKLDDNFLYADFIKIDTEGNDVNVLKSGEKLLRNSKPFLEVEVMTPEGLDFLAKLGYECVDSTHDSFFVWRPNGNSDNK